MTAGQMPVPAAIGARAHCPLGGFAPCVDDLCYGGTTLCGLEPGYDFCEHYNYPEACDECLGDDESLDDSSPAAAYTYDDSGYDDGR